MTLPANKHAQSIQILGIPMDLGQQRRGVDMGPSALRYAGLFDRLTREGHLVEDLGNLDVPVRDERSVRAHRWVEADGGGLRHLPEVVAACQAIYQEAQKAATSDVLPLFLGGDHAVAIGTVAGMTCGGPLGLLWVDAHGDFNTPETSPSGNIHGMPVAALIGRGQAELVDLGHPGPKLRPHDVVMIGIRDLDPEERTALANSGITVYTMRDVDELGMATVARRALARLGHMPRIHLSLDMDAIEPSAAPGVGTPVPGGLTFREAHLLMEIVGESHKLAALDVVEINPILDEGNRTAELAVELITSALGKRIL
jgi:arginase